MNDGPILQVCGQTVYYLLNQYLINCRCRETSPNETNPFIQIHHILVEARHTPIAFESTIDFPSHLLVKFLVADCMRQRGTNQTQTNLLICRSQKKEFGQILVAIQPKYFFALARRQVQESMYGPPSRRQRSRDQSYYDC